MAYLAPDEIYVVLENSLDPDGISWLYRHPVAIIDCHDPANFAACLARLEASVSDGLYAAGWVSYEAGYLGEPRLAGLMPPDQGVPLMWFGLFDRRDRMTRQQADHFWREQGRGRNGHLGPLTASVSQPDYIAKIKTIQDYLAAGDVYQINYTFPLTGHAMGDPACIHAQLRAAQPVPWGAYIQTADFAVSCHSPELFFERKGEDMRLRPMKGTAPRGRWAAEDQQHRDQLVADEKSRAENLMIVDLERNDLSRLARPGSVKVDSLFEAETYRSVIQMTSTVSGQVAADTSISNVLSALFPCGSVTGAPKIRAMEIIRDLEDTPRGIYTGAIGHLSPDGDMAFNVPIRTVTIAKDGAAIMGIGSGIVADSDPAAEFQECMLKSRFVDAMPALPSLIETIRWRPDEGYWLFDEHLDRLMASAQYFGYPLKMDATRLLLDQHADALVEKADQPQEAWRVRLLCSSSGSVSVKSVKIDSAGAPGVTPTFALAKKAVDSRDIYLFHKTTHRHFFDQVFETEAAPYGHRDVVFVNEAGELTEGTRTNLFILIDGILYTPPIACGLLAGTFRNSLLQRADSPAHERILKPADLSLATKIFLGNSLYGLIEVKADQKT